MIAIGFVCIVFGLVLLGVWGSKTPKVHNGADYVGAFLTIVGFVSFVLGIGWWLWQHAP